jgi:hypothetical protein
MKPCAFPLHAQILGASATTTPKKKALLADNSNLQPATATAFGQPAIAPYTASGADLMANYNQVALQRSGQSTPRQAASNTAEALVKLIKGAKKVKVPKHK